MLRSRSTGRRYLVPPQYHFTICSSTMLPGHSQKPNMFVCIASSCCHTLAALDTLAAAELICHCHAVECLAVWLCCIPASSNMHRRSTRLMPRCWPQLRRPLVRALSHQNRSSWSQATALCNDGCSSTSSKLFALSGQLSCNEATRVPGTPLNHAAAASAHKQLAPAA